MGGIDEGGLEYVLTCMGRTIDNKYQGALIFFQALYDVGRKSAGDVVDASKLEEFDERYEELKELAREAGLEVARG